MSEDRVPAHLDLIARIGSIGDRDGDSEEERLQHRLLVYMGVLMSFGGLMWGTIAAWFSLWGQSVIPYGYAVLTVFIMARFRISKNFTETRFLQVLISLLLPFMFQWVLGGFVSSGGVMLWAMLALVGSLAFTESRQVLRWLVVYAALTIISGLIDPWVAARFPIGTTPAVQTTFFVINIVVISSIVFGLTVYLQSNRERANIALADANQRISKLNESLEDEVAVRTTELQASLGRSRAILNNMADGLFAANREGMIQVANPALWRILRLDGEAHGRAVSDALPGELAVLAQRAVAEEGVLKIDVELPAGRTGIAVASPIHEGEIETARSVGSVVILRDVTLEREIDRMKTDFIATVSHELRTPLTSVLGFAKLTRRKLRSVLLPLIPQGDEKTDRTSQQVLGNLDIIVSEGERLTNLIGDVLDISKMEAGSIEWRMKALQPADLVSRSILATSILFEGGEVDITTDVDDELPAISGDFDRLMQVVINLISNAAKFTKVGSVTVSARRVVDSVEFSVTDTGEGIDASDQEKVFEKFRQVGDTLTDKPMGTGLGLPISRQIVIAHGGRIWVESAKGEGSRFAFAIPVGGQEPGATGSLDSLVDHIAMQVDQRAPTLGRDILVVDDDRNVRELLRQQLNDRGFSVREAADGYEAVKQVRSVRPDLVILDIMMPGISGYDVAAILKSDPDTEDIPILILTIIEDAERGYSVGVDSYMTKPHEPERLVSEVERLLGAGAPRRRVLVVVDQSPEDEVISMLESRGFEVVGTCTSADFVDEAERTRPDLIIIGGSAPHFDDLVRSIRVDTELADVPVLRLVDGLELKSVN